MTSGLRLTHIGGPTVLIEFAGWRILSDPTFDPPGRRYKFGWGTASNKVAGPAVAIDDLGRSMPCCSPTTTMPTTSTRRAGRCCADVPIVVTTVAGAARLGGDGDGPRAVGDDRCSEGGG